MTRSKEILQKLRKFRFPIRQLSIHSLSGSANGFLHGTGMNFKEVREYATGDDIRFIDWNVSARMGHTYVKVFEEEKELSIYLLADISASISFGSKKTKKEAIEQICADIAFSILSEHHPIGLLLFGDSIEHYLIPQKNQGQLEMIIHELLSYNSFPLKTNVSSTLAKFNKMFQKKGVVFILSDFIDIEYTDALKSLSGKHTVIGIQLYDKRDMYLPDVGLLHISDIETGETLLLDTSVRSVREHHTQQFKHFLETTQQAFKQAGARLIQFDTEADHFISLESFFYGGTR